MFPQSKITEVDIIKATPRENAYKLTVGGALYLLVSPSGGKYWRMKYRFNGKENAFSIGSFPKISLQQAIEARDNAKTLLKEGLDPNFAKQKENKEKTKPLHNKAQFRIDMSSDGVLTIETEKKIISLTKPQVKALQSFLATLPMEKEA